MLKKMCMHTEPLPTPTHTQESNRASTLTGEDGGFALAGEQWRAKAKTAGRSWKVPTEGCLCAPRSSQGWGGGEGAEMASCKVAGVSSAASTQIFTHKQHITQQLPFVRRNGSSSNNGRAERQAPQFKLEQDAFLQLAGQLIESSWELGLTPTKLLLLASESQLHLQKLSPGCTVIYVCITSFVAPRGTRASSFRSPEGAMHLPWG